MIEKLQMMFFMLSNDLTAKRDERGATAVEYGLLVAGIAAVIVVVVFALGVKVDAAFDTVIGQFP
ncbi:Flp family type IVb pilin [Nocardioides bruguierae]|uniref:Flp family type IVb pilin n=1 Tax=Nocardioides bruguierae TaxID=2945102 RepID=UPI0020213227|nr:Flp family type IVb pilin [Nocardioides bruguierae]MCL8024817.1 Flp family type IVb pilin [Nocardioides bruguierae]